MIYELRARLISACGDVGLKFYEVADPVVESDSYIVMTFWPSDELALDRLIRVIRTSIASGSPEDVAAHYSCAQKIGVQVRKSFIESNCCWSVCVALSDEGYRLTEAVEA